ncbi:efflux RND transporter permease subunit [uncultured Algimonas sp.]|uniref:efflux RND transporter permease subunit n=1 Tax=uncultured Algimonas sp. TaxID=1547920 RepID=UPI0026196280|nr:efflux RND transporter permease subunit [uncultured Algimonas sp.]
MLLSEFSVKRPMVAAVMSLLLVAGGIVAFLQLPLRQYPDIDPPVVSIETVYPGAAADIVETRVTEILEERIAGVEGIETISATSEDGRSNIDLTFYISRDVDAAANDVRDRVSGILDDLPVEADPPEISKVDSNQDVITWLNLVGEGRTVPELTDYAERFLVDRFSAIDGVARVRVGGAQSYAVRIWLDRAEMAARGVTAGDVEARLRAENVEFPAGSIESVNRQFTVRVDRAFTDMTDFAGLGILETPEGFQARLGDIARVEFGVEEERNVFRGNTIPQIGLGIVRQSTANTVEVARDAQAEAARINESLPEGMRIFESFDTSVFISGAINEVYKTLGLAAFLVTLVIYLFLGSLRAAFVPALTLPVALIGAFLAIWVLGFSINLLTLLALVLAIGLVVDDAIVVLENIFRRMDEYGESPLLAAYRGAGQVGFAVIATTIVLVSVFVPIAFLQGDVGRLFSEFALTIAAAVVISSFVALTLTPALASKALRPTSSSNQLQRALDNGFKRVRGGYARLLDLVLRAPLVGLVLIGLGAAGSVWSFSQLPQAFAPAEDRGAFFVIVRGPEGASHDYMTGYMDEIERRMMPLVEAGEVQRLLLRTPAGFGNVENFNTGIVITVLTDWSQRRNGFEIMNQVRTDLSDLPGVRAFPVMRQGFGGGAAQKPLQITLGGGSWEELSEWRATLFEAMADRGLDYPGLDWDYKETQPQVRVQIDYDRANALGVRVAEIGRTLETMLGSRRVTTFLQEGEEYDVLLEGEQSDQRTPLDMTNIFVRSDDSGRLIPLANVITLRETGGSRVLSRYNRVRAITVEANLPEGVSLGDALADVESVIRDVLPEQVIVDYKGESLDLRQTGSSVMLVFAAGIGIVFLVLAAQFESVRHPLVIMLSVPVATVGGLIALQMAGQSLNLYSQIGLIMLVGLAAKNGILIVEFANQLRDEGQEFLAALSEASLTRFRPIVMTGVTTIAGATPLVIASGAGAETRYVIGLVIVGGVLTSTIVSLLTVPAAYALIARGSGSPGDTARQLEVESERHARGGLPATEPAE